MNSLICMVVLLVSAVIYFDSVKVTFNLLIKQLRTRTCLFAFRQRDSSTLLHNFRGDFRDINYDFVFPIIRGKSNTTDYILI